MGFRYSCVVRDLFPCLGSPCPVLLSWVGSALEVLTVARSPYLKSVRGPFWRLLDWVSEEASS